MKILNQEIMFEIENKKRAALSCGIIMLCFGYTVINFFQEKPNPPAIPQTQQTASQMKQTDSESEIIHLSKPSLEALLKINPFVEVKSVAEGTAEPENRTVSVPLPAIPRSSGSASPPSRNVNVPLPAIPGHSSVSIPAPGKAMPAPAAVPKASATVQGVLTGENGENMAIMSDGCVVQEGDTYQDGRIAYIGGDGITFEDGHRINYK